MSNLGSCYSSFCSWRRTNAGGRSGPSPFSRSVPNKSRGDFVFGCILLDLGRRGYNATARIVLTTARSSVHLISIRTFRQRSMH